MSYIEGRIEVRIFRIPTFDTLKAGLSLAIFGGLMVASGTCPAGVPRNKDNYLTTAPGLLVFRLRAKLAPALIENRLVEARFDVDTSSWRFKGA